MQQDQVRGEIWITTAGYSYSDWVGPVYPPGTPPGAFLRLFAERFSAVELNFPYYRMPTAHAMEAIAAKVPGHFRFVVKAHKSLTHDRSGDPAAPAREFASGVAPLRDRSMLAGVLLQFPYSFRYNDSNRLYLDRLLKTLGEECFVEFRHADWQQDSVVKGLADRGAGIVNVDLPALRGLPERREHITAGTAYLRLHGRRADTWWRGTNVTRYDYLYNQNEMDEVEARTKKLAAGAQLVFVVFNNHFAGKAVANAESLVSSLEAGGAAKLAPGVVTLGTTRLGYSSSSKP